MFSTEGVYPTHEGADAIFTELAVELDRYSRSYGEIADLAWEKEFSGTDSRRKMVKY